MKIFILSFVLLIGSSITTNAQNIRLTLDNISTDISCNDIWIEEGINLPKSVLVRVRQIKMGKVSKKWSKTVVWKLTHDNEGSEGKFERN